MRSCTFLLAMHPWMQLCTEYRFSLPFRFTSVGLKVLYQNFCNLIPEKMVKGIIKSTFLRTGNNAKSDTSL